MMNSLCYINNRFLYYDETRLQVSDLGIQRGYSIFDYFLEIDGRIPFFEDYLDRFYASAKRLNLEVPLNREMMKEKIAYLLQQNKHGDSGIKLMLTGGYSEDHFSPSVPNFMILNLPLIKKPADFADGVRLLLLDYQRHLPEVKTTFYLPSIALIPKMKEVGAIEVLYHHNGLLSETTRANIFLINNKTLITPSSDILKGITRKYVLRLAKNVLPVVEREVKLDEIWESEEIFITGTSKHVAPVVEIEGRMIGNGKPGEVTKMISEAYERFFELS